MKKWKKTAARLAAARRNIKRAQAARLGKRPKADHLRNLRDQHVDPLLKDVPLRVADQESELDFYKRQLSESQNMNRKLTSELEHLRTLARFVDYVTRRGG